MHKIGNELDKSPKRLRSVLANSQIANPFHPARMSPSLSPGRTTRTHRDQILIGTGDINLKSGGPSREEPITKTAGKTADYFFAKRKDSISLDHKQASQSRAIKTSGGYRDKIIRKGLILTSKAQVKDTSDFASSMADMKAAVSLTQSQLAMLKGELVPLSMRNAESKLLMPTRDLAFITPRVPRQKIFQQDDVSDYNEDPPVPLIKTNATLNTNRSVKPLSQKTTKPSKEGGTANYLGFRIPHLDESLLTSTTNVGYDVLTHSAIWKRIRIDETRMSKQTIKMEVKLGLIQKNASLANNVEKRNALMSESDRQYHNFVQETVDRIQRMRSLAKKPQATSSITQKTSSPVNQHIAINRKVTIIEEDINIQPKKPLPAEPSPLDALLAGHSPRHVRQVL